MFTRPLGSIVAGGIFGTAILLLLTTSIAAQVAGPVAPSPDAEGADIDQPETDQPGPVDEETKSILDMDIEQLSRVDVVVPDTGVGPSMQTEVTSVAKQESTVGRSAAAVFVITPEMIRRSGANSIPDLLRMVPGLEVSRIDAHTWAIASRGFNGRYTKKLLVLIDGRSVYTPVNSGVHWDVQDLILEDIERIEVIRGPGGTVWGANAVNGVINIITKSAKDTQGTLITSGGGSEDRAINAVRHGGQNGDGLFWRVYGKHTERDAGFHPEHGQHNHGGRDDWRMGRGGFRVDWMPDDYGCNTLTVQGDAYEGQVGGATMSPSPVFPYASHFSGDTTVSGVNVLTRWTHVFNDDSDWALQLYFDRAYRGSQGWQEDINTFDVDFQHRFPWGRRHRAIWGIEHRHVHSGLIPDGFAFDFVPSSRTTNLFSTFLQDEMTLVEDRLTFTVGSKFESNYFTGFEYQPSARLLYTPDRQHSLWAAVSRAVRTPSRYDHDGQMMDMLTPVNPSDPAQGYYFPRYDGSPAFRSEDLVAYEIGYRAQMSERFAWDLAWFYNVYENLQAWSYDPGDTFMDPYGNAIVPILATNGTRGETYGAEVTGQWTMSENWRLSASYSFLQIQLHTLPQLFETLPSEEGTSPHNQVRFRSSWDLGRHWEFDLGLRYVDNLPAIVVPKYITMDLRLGWVPSENFELAVVGRNLFDGHHREFTTDDFGIQTSDVQRSVFAKATWRY